MWGEGPDDDYREGLARVLPTMGRSSPSSLLGQVSPESCNRGEMILLEGSDSFRDLVNPNPIVSLFFVLVLWLADFYWHVGTYK